MVSIRSAHSADAASLAAIADRTFRQTFAEANSAENIELHCAKNFNAAIQHREISDPRLITLVAEVAGELIAFAQLRLAHSTNGVVGTSPAELHRIYVTSEWHGRGVAHELMRAALAAATEAGSDCLWLGVWEQNLKAIAFYRKFGFSVVGDHPFMLGQDRQRDLVMVTKIGGLSSVA